MENSFSTNTYSRNSSKGLNNDMIFKYEKVKKTMKIKDDMTNIDAYLTYFVIKP